MEVRDQHRVEVAPGLAAGPGAVPPRVARPVPQKRVGEESGAAELDQHGGVSDVGQAPAGYCVHITDSSHSGDAGPGQPKETRPLATATSTGAITMTTGSGA